MPRSTAEGFIKKMAFKWGLEGYRETLSEGGGKRIGAAHYRPKRLCMSNHRHV